MNHESTNSRRHYSPEQKVNILRRHLLEGRPISEVNDQPHCIRACGLDDNKTRAAPVEMRLEECERYFQAQAKDEIRRSKQKMQADTDPDKIHQD